MSLIKMLYMAFGFLAAFLIIIIICGFAGLDMNTAVVVDLVIIVISMVAVFSVIRKRRRKAEEM